MKVALSDQDMQRIVEAYKTCYIGDPCNKCGLVCAWTCTGCDQKNEWMKQIAPLSRDGLLTAYHDYCEVRRLRNDLMSARIEYERGMKRMEERYVVPSFEFLKGKH